MNIDSKINILWLSDIHYSSNYIPENTNDVFKNFTSSFLSKCDEFEEVDYLLLSGDIAQKGTVEDYDLFFNDFLNPLFDKEKFKKTKLILVSGNHDVFRKENLFFEKFVKSLNEESDTRITFLNKNKKEIKKSFQNFSNSFKKFEDKLPDSISNQYKKDFLHGYFIDHQKKAIIILLNSSWYSFGNEFIKRYFDIYFNFLSFPKLDDSQIKKIVNFISKENDNTQIQINNFIKEGIFNFFKNIYQIDFSKGKIEKIIEFINNELHTSDKLDLNDVKDIFISKKERADIIKDLINITEEYGNQIVNLDAFPEYDDLIKTIETYNEYVCLQCFHHPVNWLQIKERVNYDSLTVDSKFFKLQDSIDILLTGHEHVPINYPSDYSNNKKILNVAGGCFLEYSAKVSEFDLNNNWFSVLTINTKKRTLIQRKFQSIKEENSIHWQEIDSVIKALEKKYKSKLNLERIRDVKLYVSDKKNHLSIITKIASKEVNVVEGFDDYYFNEKNVYKIVDNSFLFNGTFNKDKSLYLCDEYNTFNFIFIDLLFYENDYHKGEDRLVAINEIVSKIDYEFDKKRHDFFSNLKNDEIHKTVAVKFVSKIIPFWEISL